MLPISGDFCAIAHTLGSTDAHFTKAPPVHAPMPISHTNSPTLVAVFVGSTHIAFWIISEVHCPDCENSSHHFLNGCQGSTLSAVLAINSPVLPVPFISPHTIPPVKALGVHSRTDC